MQDTKESIKQTYMNLYKAKGPENLNIKEVCEETPVARTTFYIHFHNLNEVKEEIQDNLIEGLLKLADEDTIRSITDKALSSYFVKVFEYIKQHWDYIYAFLVSFPDITFMEKWKTAIKRHFAVRYPQKVNISNYSLISEMIASGIIGAYIYWMKNPEQFDAESISLISAKVLGEIKFIL